MNREELLLAFKEGKYSAEEVLVLLQKQKRSALSEGQKELWMLQKLYPEMAGFNLPLGLKISQGFNRLIFEKACHFVLDQYPILTATFDEENGVPFYRFDQERGLDLNYTEVTGRSGAEIISEMRKRFKKPFNPKTDQLIRFNVYSESPDSAYILVTVHHIIFDGTSAILFLDALLEAYHRLVQGEQPEKRSEEARFSDFVKWEQEMLEDPASQEHFDFWKEQFKGELPMTAMPSDRAARGARTFEGTTKETLIQGDLLHKVREFSAESGVNQAVIFLAAFKAFIYRYTGQEDLIIGMPTAGRPQKEFEEVLGYFIYMVSVRNKVSGDSTFTDFLKEIQYKLVDTLDHASYPTTKVLRELNISGNQAALRLFKVSFFYQNFVKGAKSQYDRFQPQFEVELLNGLHQEGEQEFVLEVFDEKDYLQLNCHYDPQVFDKRSIDGIIDNYLCFLGELISSPKLKIDHFQLLAPSQQEKILGEWKGKKKELPAQTTVVDLFEEQVRNNPDQIALVFDKEEISYQELSDRSNALASHLAELISENPEYIGVGCERSTDMIVAILAVLKLGAAYIPIDPEYPAERIVAILEESNPAAIISTSKVSSVFESFGKDIPVIEADSDFEGNTEFTSRATVKSLAYVLFTSGSTGKPKGVMVNHLGLLNLSIAMKEAYRITSADRVMQFASLSFDMSVEEIFPYLTSGAAIVIRQKDDIESQRFLDLVSSQGISILNLPPAMAQTIIQYSKQDKNRFFRTLRLISFGGDQLEPEVTNALRPYGITIFNAYGPTEYTVNATLADLTSENTVTIGRPIINTEVFILDKNLRPLPVLAHGELYISGAGIASGYLNQEELTKERFVDNPFVPGTKMYRTGDNVRWNADGSIEFLGRLDHQVKIRGFRVELQEIESVMVEHRDISSAVVIARKNGNEKWLAGYFTTSDPNKEVSETVLKNMLTERLPDYMIPARLIQLDVLPITSNGKTDRKALEQLELTFESSKEYIAPVTEIAKKVVSVWEEVLGVNQIGMEDNFFELGGHSLLATQVISGLNKALEINIPLSSIFENPQVVTLSDYIEQNLAKTTYEQIPVAENRELFPLSYAQERLWFLAETGLSEQYHVPLLFDVAGKFYPDAFRVALNAVVARHESLRTVFVADEEIPMQRIATSIEIAVAEYDPDDHSVNQEDIIDQFINTPFDLAHGPLIRAMIIRKSKDQWTFGINMHHIICDGWSSQVLATELSGFYNAAVDGGDFLPGELKVQYADFAGWQREQSGQWLADDLSYWQEKLRGHQDLDLPTDFPRPKKVSGKGGRVKALIGAEEIARLKKVCSNQNTTFFSLLMTAVYILLKKYSRQSDIAIGYTSSNRIHPDIQELIGFFVNTLVLRVESYDSLIKVEELIRNIHHEIVSNQDHQQLPFEKLVEELQPVRDPGRSPIFQTMVTYLNNSQSALDMADQQVSFSEYDYQVSKFDLSFDFNESQNGELALAIEYATDLFLQETVERMLGHLITIIGELGDLSQNVNQLNFISQQEKKQLLEDFNQSEEPYPTTSCIHELFDEQVKKTPELIAVTDGERSLTYEELHINSEKLANYLINQGVGKEAIITICMDRSVELITAVFAVLKAGAAYLPVGIENPDDRIAYMLQDSDSQIVFTDQKEEKRLQALAGNSQVIALDEQFISDLPDQIDDLPELTPQNLCYVIYTSGSTGKPKGVLLQHRGVINYIYDMIKYYRFGKTDVGRTTYAFMSNISFDATSTAYFVPLLSGGTSYVVSAELDQTEIVKKVFESDEINCMCMTPSHLKLFLETGLTPSTTKKMVSFGGEALRKEWVDKLMASGLNGEVVNVYGPTECSIAASAHLFDRERNYQGSIPIGGPMSNARLYVLDTENQLLPVGVPGELHIGGDGLARGYHKRPELTAERFIDNPYAEGEKIYKTGDLARWLPTGEIEFLGRVDDQVKIRGYRIELGEIENLILSFDEIDNCAVMVTGEDSEKNLVAYFQSSANPDPQELKRLAREQLPKYMVPVAFIAMDPLPLTPNGKINRKYLETLPVEIARSGEYVAPENDIQELMAEIWADILKLDRVGIKDDFFEIGGHSLLATQIITRTNKVLGADLEINQLFESSSIEELSLLIRKDNSATDKAPAIQRVTDRPDRIPASYAQKRLWFMDKIGQGQSFHTPYVCEIHGFIDHVHLNSALLALIERHEALRTVFTEIEGKPFQKIMDESGFSLDYQDLSLLRKSDQVRLMEEITHRYIHEPFNLSEGPLIRAALIRTASARFRLVLCLHHIITDGWSVNIMLKELSELYEASIQEREDRLLPLPIQYADYAIWQNEDSVREKWDKELLYWKEKLDGYKDLNLPVDFFRENQTDKQGEQEMLHFDSEELSLIRKFCRAQKITPFALMMSSVYLILSRYSRQKDFCIGFPVANRNQQEKEALIGFFLNTLIVRINTEDEEHITARELVKLVQEQIVESQVHQNIPVDKIIECLQPDRNSALTPVFQVMMNYLKTSPEGTFTIGGAQIIPTPVDYDSSKFDLTFSFGENQEDIIASIEYNQDIFSPETIGRMANLLKMVVRNLIENSESRVDDISMIGDQERENLLVGRNDTWSSYPVDRTIHDLFREQVNRTPEAIALRFGDSVMTYRELDDRSDRMATYLRNKGVQDEELVGLMADRSMEMIIGILGILKAGAAYLPIDPNYPADRISHIIKDSQVRKILTTGEITLPKDANIEMIDLLSEMEEIDKCVVTKISVAANALAYMIYTSGSTGKPKGVMVEHRNVVNHNLAAIRIYDLDETDNVMQFSTISFDIFVEEVFPTLLCGASLTLLESSRFTDPDYIKTVIRENGITTLNLPTAFWNAVATEDFGNTAVRRVIIGGEKAELGTFKNWQINNAHIPVINTYGPTEATVIALTAIIDSNQDRPVPIGKPIDNVQVYVLDAKLNTCAVGVPGELFISGAGVARGYHGNEELTAEKFIENPFIPGKKMYRTGDLVRWLNDGNIEFLGRVDDQVKIRGYRIEPGEVEHALRSIGGISNVAVIVKEISGVKHLAAFYVSENEMSVPEIKTALHTRLPDYMVPSFFEPIIAIPLTTNGKVDKRKLEKVNLNAIANEDEYVAPAGEVEEQLVRIWEELLGKNRISVNQDFFRSGGHSLLAIQLMSRITDTFEVEITLNQLIANSSVREMAAIISKSEKIDNQTLTQFIKEGDEFII